MRPEVFIIYVACLMGMIMMGMENAKTNRMKMCFELGAMWSEGTCTKFPDYDK